MPFNPTDLFVWYKKSKRDLPWRRNPTPYKVWVSEIMLQQTQVKTVLPYYERFIRRFPSLNSLAQASESEVLSYWTGLGYYSRGRNLYKTAKIVRKIYGGQFPQTKEELLKLPGIGRYSAGAILSIAFHQPVPLLDGNVKRILSRLILENSEDKLWKLADEIVVEAASKKIDPSDHNQALMELGALVCLPEAPRCVECPLRDSCAANKRNLVLQYPLKRKSSETVHLNYALFVIKKDGNYLLHKRSPKERWLKNMWEFPMLEARPKNYKALLSDLKKKTGLSIGLERSLPSFSHTITHHRLKITPFYCSVIHSNGIEKNSSYAWVKESEIKRYSSSSILSKALREIRDSSLFDQIGNCP